MQINEPIHRALALELVDKHNAATVVERKVIHSLGYIRDRVVEDSKQQGLQLVDRPWRVGTKFLVLYAGNPRLVAPIEDLRERHHIVGLFRERTHQPALACDIRISTRCKKPTRFRVIHYKDGQYLCFHRACDRCIDWLMHDEGPAKKKRLDQLMAYE